MRTATVGTTGTPSSRASTAGSSTSPSRSARSTILSATTTGRPSAISCRAKRRWLSRLAASITTIIASGTRSKLDRPVTTSRVTRSSGEEGSRL
ncbi:pectin methylesterase-like acyl-CoA thioesterase [Sphingomonas sp. SORGH_AS438]|nr:pectin methylesterase-like acyl-CoA thioesterase [Sphingomonas sp. SORGH_AS_0438]